MADKNDDEAMWMVLFIGAILALLTFGIWYVFKAQLLQGLIWFRQGEFALAALWTDPKTVYEVTINGAKQTVTFESMHELVKRITPSMLLSDDISMRDTLGAISRAALEPFRYIFGGIFVVLCVWILFNGPTSKFRRVLDLNGLIREQARTFPVVAPFINFNPKETPVRAPGMPVPEDLPLFAEALGPEEFIAHHQITGKDGNFSREMIDQAFKKQLIAPWRGWKYLAKENQVLLAAFCLKAVRDRTRADDMLGRIALCWDHKGGLNLSKDPGLVGEARSILKKESLSGMTLKQCNHHAFVTTALLRAMDVARDEGGVLAPAQFVWLRGHNRTLWYPLNNLGRQAFHPEALGAMSHYRAEKVINRPIPKPRLDDATTSLLDYLNDPILRRPIPGVEYSKKKAKKKNTGVMKPV